jgi:hypothetical protein
LEDATSFDDYFGPQPSWFDEARIVATADESDPSSESKMPITAVLKRGNTLNAGEILELRASFLPAPGIDLMRAKGFLSWSVETAGDEIHTYFTKSSE